MLLHKTLWAAGLVAVSPVAVAEAPAALDSVVVTATRYETDSAELAATVTTVDAETLERRSVTDDAELLRDEVDVVLNRDLRRFGAAQVNIRGIEGNRVTQLVDGVRLPDYYNGGGPGNFTFSAPLGASPDFLKRIEILRGPASSLYGSDALGGVVGTLTLNPDDLLTGTALLGGQFRSGYTSANEGWRNTLLGAGRNAYGKMEWLLGYSHTEASELDNQGEGEDVSSASRTLPNPQDIQDQGLLAKLNFKFGAGHALRFTLEGRAQDAEVAAKRLSVTLPKVTAVSGDDHTERLRTGLEWEHRPPAAAFYDRLTLRLYHQDSETENFNEQTRSNTGATCSASSGTGNTCRVEQDFYFSQASWGGGVQFESAFNHGAVGHLLSYGLDLGHIETEQLRDARVWNLTTGRFSQSLAGDKFPLRDFPIGETDSAGLFLQDEVSGLANGRLILTGGLRYDWRRLTPKVDALAQQVLTANQREAVEQTDAGFSPKLAALWKLDATRSLYGQIVRGFRAPNYEEVNGSFRNTAQRYGIVPNPDLEPETSLGVEVGLKLHTPTLSGQLAVYDTHYEDFIENVRLSCPADPRCIADLNTTFISVNLSEVRIYGAEARLAWQFAPGWKLDGALAYAHGDNKSDNVPLNSVDPARFTLGLTRDAGRWGAEGRIRGAAAVTRTDDREGVWFRPESYATLDLYGWWQPWRGGRINLGLTNLLDEQYWLWSDIRQADARNPAGVDFYSQPGRAVSLSFNQSF